jgi:hypothetical protein
MNHYCLFGQHPTGGRSPLPTRHAEREQVRTMSDVGRAPRARARPAVTPNRPDVLEAEPIETPQQRHMSDFDAVNERSRSRATARVPTWWDRNPVRQPGFRRARPPRKRNGCPPRAPFQVLTPATAMPSGRSQSPAREATLHVSMKLARVPGVTGLEAPGSVRPTTDRTVRS